MPQTIDDAGSDNDEEDVGKESLRDLKYDSDENKEDATELISLETEPVQRKNVPKLKAPGK